MKKTIKWVLAGAVLLLCGGLLFVGGMSALGWDFYRLDTTEYTEKSFEAAADAPQITRVELDIDSFPVVLTQGETVRLTYYEPSDGEATVSCENGVLSVKQKSDFRFWRNSWFQLKRNKYPYTLTLPEGMDVTLGGANARLRADGVRLGTLTVSVTNLSMEFTGVTLSSLSVRATNGDLEWSRVTAGDTEVTGTNLDIEAQDCDFAALSVTGTNLDAEIGNTVAPVLNVRGTNADVTLNHVTADTISVRGTNLDAFVRVAGKAEDYSVLSDGRGLPAPRTGATDKSVSFSGTNNDVELYFTA